MLWWSYRYEFDRHLGSTAVEMPVQLESDWKNLNLNLATLRLRDILWENVRPLSEKKPWYLAIYNSNTAFDTQSYIGDLQMESTGMWSLNELQWLVVY